MESAEPKTKKEKCQERVLFRLIRMPCCGQLLCWVNPRLPNFCPECKESVYSRLKFEGDHFLLVDDNAWLTTHR